MSFQYQLNASDIHGPAVLAAFYAILAVECAGHPFGDLWMWLQLMCLQFEAVRSPVGAVWGQFVWVWGPTGPKSTPNGPDRTSDNFKLQPHEL